MESLAKMVYNFLACLEHAKHSTDFCGGLGYHCGNSYCIYMVLGIHNNPIDIIE